MGIWLGGSLLLVVRTLLLDDDFRSWFLTSFVPLFLLSISVSIAIISARSISFAGLVLRRVFMVLLSVIFVSWGSMTISPAFVDVAIIRGVVKHLSFHAQLLFTVVHVLHLLEDRLGSRRLLEQTQHLHSGVEVQLGAVAVLADGLVAEVDAGEGAVGDVLDVDPLDAEHAGPFGVLPPETEGLGRVDLGHHLRDAHVLVAVDDGEEEVHRALRVALVAAEGLVERLVVLAGAGPESVLDGLRHRDLPCGCRRRWTSG